MVLTRFWRNLTKKDSVESAKYEINNFSTCTYIFLNVFYRSGSGFLADPDSDKKVRSGSGKKVQIQNIGKFKANPATRVKAQEQNTPPLQQVHLNSTPPPNDSKLNPSKDFSRFKA